MSICVPSAFYLAQLLDAEGFPLPQGCREARVIIGVDQALMIQYDVLLSPEDTVKLGKALQRLGQAHE